MKRFILLIILSSFIISLYGADTPQWNIFETAFKGPETGNPFMDVTLTAEFKNQNRTIKVTGFYDGNGIYKIRFMPEELGQWTFKTSSNVKALNGQTGSFVCTAPDKDNHGPVKVVNTFHFAYSDGTPYKQIGTTCYAWTHQPRALQEQTLETLANSAFNKIRMCIFPKDYVYSRNAPDFYPFMQNADSTNDFTRFDPAYWAHFEQRILDLQKLGIEADLILFHPYDRWGYAKMTAEQDAFYLKYTLARLSAFRNVWWSLANEFDLMEYKTMDDWDQIYRVIIGNDPYDHLRGIHNCRGFYDHTKPWVTHCSIQSSDFSQIKQWQELYQKPILYDECRYEGNIPEGWGNITAEEMVNRFWIAAAAGCYLGHGETYKHPEDIIWWSKGGVLHGQSPERIQFFKTIFDGIPAEGISYIDDIHGGVKDKYFLYYFGKDTPAEWTFKLPPYLKYQVDIIDVWNMTITPQDGAFFESFSLNLPEQPYIAVRVQAVDFSFPYPAVDISPASPLFLKDKTIALSHPSGNPIYYTLNGSAPGIKSAKYTKPVKISEDGTELNAVCIDSDGLKSKLTTLSYKKVTPLPGIEVTEKAPGIHWKLYHGKWNMLPDFEKLPHVKTGISAQIDLSPQDRPDEFGLVFQGLIEIPQTDIYTFSTHSDDGTQLWIGNKRIINNDGNHAPTKVSGDIALEKGLHAIRVRFFENAGGEMLEVFWQNSKTDEEIIPSQVLFHMR